MNLNKKLWLIKCSCDSEKGNIGKHIAAMIESLDLYSTYENIIVWGNFNVEIQNKCLINFYKKLGV